jgi:hypothetical protein
MPTYNNAGQHITVKLARDYGYEKHQHHWERQQQQIKQPEINNNDLNFSISNDGPVIWNRCIIDRCNKTHLLRSSYCV